MGWTVLYIAFGIVALWLLGEVLLQYKARLRWRLVAFAGFLGVVVGVLMPNVIVIGIGAAAFAVGQTYVTLSFRRGFSTGWALGGSPGSSRRRRPSAASADRDPVLQVTGIDYGDSYSYDDRVPPGPSGPATDQAPAAETTAVYEPQPLPDDTNQYGVYPDAQYSAEHGRDADGYGRDGGDYGRGDGVYPDAQYSAEHGRDADGYGQGAAEHGRDGGADASYGGYSSGYTDAYSQGHGYEQQAGTHDTYAESYGYGTGQQYAAYSDPYAGGAAQGYEAYGSYGGQQQYTDPYASQGYNDTPPGGVWVPLQRDGDQVPPPEQPPQYDYDQGYRNDPDGQTYRQ
ncbi:hypothetical protein SSP531S_25470 [Streptomyces spongiicola]|uniref:Uncharacterized protein n=1 Tax=Streptomyces spongiicola TaxID=1690221 RepID=A0A388SXN5_9ACTN|nr:hypothetical protein [Streptomyces spongiicola]GBQ01116.1 hypothetical protein SSP531S_25470 [Streptomyces spongiicola]